MAPTDSAHRTTHGHGRLVDVPRPHRYGTGRSSVLRSLRRSFSLAAAAWLVALVVLLPARYFGTIETALAIELRAEAGCALGVVALAAAGRCALVATRHADRLSAKSRLLWRLPLLFTIPLVVYAILVWYGSR